MNNHIKFFQWQESFHLALYIFLSKMRKECTSLGEKYYTSPLPSHLSYFITVSFHQLCMHCYFSIYLKLNLYIWQTLILNSFLFNIYDIEIQLFVLKRCSDLWLFQILGDFCKKLIKNSKLCYKISKLHLIIIKCHKNSINAMIPQLTKSCII